MKQFAIALSLVVGAASAGAAQVPAPPPAVAEVGAALVAKRVGSGVFLSGRSVESILAEEFAPETGLDRMLRPLVDVDVDHDAQTVTATVAGVQRTAVYRVGLGCTIALGRSAAELRSEAIEPVIAEPADPASVPWPTGEAVPKVDDHPELDRDAMLEAVARAFDEPRAEAKARTRAVAVVYRGQLVAERYAAGFDRNTRLEGWSMTKSVTHALVGIRVRQEILELDRPTGLAAWSGENDDRASLTLDHLLRMSSGLSWNESYTNPASDVVQMLFVSPDVPALPANKPLANLPDARWQYSSGTTNVICRVLRESFDSLDEYLAFPRRELFNRIGMRSAVIEVGPAGNLVGSSLMWATARDWARFGLLYLRGGVWEGERILPEGWVESGTESTDGSRGRYGRHWWLNAGESENPDRRPYPKLPRDMFYASGFEGQTLAIFPSHDLVVVRLGCTKNSRAWNLGRFLRGVLASIKR